MIAIGAAPDSGTDRWSAFRFVAVGLVVVLAACGGDSATRPQPEAPVASVTVSPDTATVSVGSTIQLRAIVRDAEGNVLTDRSVTWSTVDPVVVRVDSSGLVVGVLLGEATIEAKSAGHVGRALIGVTKGSLTFASVAPGGGHTCGLTVHGIVYCWGENLFGSPGDGSMFDSPLPVPVAGGLTFQAVSAGSSHACGLTPDGLAYCWGDNFNGQLGAGPGLSSNVPVAVAKGLTYLQLEAGGDVTCGVTESGVVYCWGNGWSGQLGDGRGGRGHSTSVPIPVASTLMFSRVSPGGGHTCALSVDGLAYCWGGAGSGAIGPGRLTGPEDCEGPCVKSPVLVTDGRKFTAITGGGSHTCALTPEGQAYCWGLNDVGQLGGEAADEACGSLSARPCSRTPIPVTGGLTFGLLSAGWRHTCGVASDGSAYCWGRNEEGQLGDGGTMDRPVPTLVSGGLTFTVLRAGSTHTCGVIPTGQAYCWGTNRDGQLGDGTTVDRLTPVRVADPE